eukprot:289255-Chlamydomonas_euryale.AAC.7
MGLALLCGAAHGRAPHERNDAPAPSVKLGQTAVSGIQKVSGVPEATRAGRLQSQLSSTRKQRPPASIAHAEGRRVVRSAERARSRAMAWSSSDCLPVTEALRSGVPVRPHGTT